MDYKKAIEVLINLSKKGSLTAQEKEAVAVAIGALDCAALADSKFKGYINSKKAKRERSMEI